MARSIAEIYTFMASVKANMQELHGFITDPSNPASVEDNAESLLADLRSKSKVAIWRLFLWVFAVGSWVVETFFDRHKTEIKGIMDAKRPHTLRWYAEESKKYQHGYALVWANNTYNYPVYDESARIIKYSAATESNGKVILKVAKELSSVKVPLTQLEKSTFTEFWRTWKDAGVKIEIISQVADILKIDITIIRDRLVLTADNSLIRDSSVFPIADAIKTFGSSLEFDGILRLSKLVDTIQLAEGVVDVKLNHAWHKPAGGTYTEVALSVTSVAGYFVIDQTSIYDYQDNVIAQIE